MNQKTIKTTIPKKLNSFAVNGDLNLALRSWKRMLKENSTVEELRDRKTYTKPSENRNAAKQRKKYETRKNIKGN
jgi:ribosomal protein S21